MKKAVLFTLLLIVVGATIYNLYPEKKLPANTEIYYIVVKKSDRELLAYSKHRLIKTYQISLGDSPVGHKAYEGDIAHAKLFGKPVGGDIKIHGIRNNFGFIGKFQRFSDWTNGCMALTNSEVDELYATVKIGTRIDIRP